MSDTPDDALAAMHAAIEQVANGNLRARVTLPESASPSMKALAEDINRLIVAWRTSELQARKTKRALEDKVATIEAQAVAIRELSTPIMQIWSGILLVPVVGNFDERRSTDITQELLQELTRTQSSHVIVDVTGVEEVDTQTADHLVRMVRSAKLLGAQAVVTGVSPSVAQTLTSLGSDISEIVTRRTLEQGLLACLGED